MLEEDIKRKEEQCLSEINSESDERITFRNRASGPLEASSSAGQPRRQCQLPS